MPSFGKSFLNDASTRLAKLLGIDGAVSPTAAQIEQLVSVILVGDATLPGYGPSRRQYSSTISAAAAAFRTWQAARDTIITRIFMTAASAPAAAGSQRVQYYGPELATTTVVTQGGIFYDGGGTSEVSDLLTGTVGAATGATILLKSFPVLAVGDVVLDLDFGDGFLLKQGARIQLDASQAFSADMTVFGKSY